MLYKAAGGKVTIEKEVEHLASYIDLQKMRFGIDSGVRFDVALVDRQTRIQPMLLIPFVDNAFQHGIGTVQDPCIEIQLRASKYELVFTVRNKFNRQAHRSKDENSGNGLVNVRNQLNDVYKGLHSLLISNNESWYSIELHLILTPP